MSDRLLPVAILAGGLGQRLGPLTARVPKALVDVAGEPFIAHQLRLLQASGARRVVICVGFLGESIQNVVGDGHAFGVEAVFSYDGPHLLGTAGALNRALPFLGDAFLVLYGDSYLTCDYQRVQSVFEASRKLALMTVFRNQGMWDSSNVEFDDGVIRAYDKRSSNARMQHIDYGLGVFGAAAFAAVPDDEPFDLATLYQALLRRDQLAACEVHERFYEIGSPAGLAETRAHLAALTHSRRGPA
jgi:MurNAc alpha-1-phosphate uridylyltransferase